MGDLRILKLFRCHDFTVAADPVDRFFGYARFLLSSIGYIRRGQDTIRMEYDEWIPRISEIVGMGQGPKHGPPPSRRWLLAPARNDSELTEDEELALNKAVHSQMADATGKLRIEAKHHIDRLNGPRLLPLLYAARMVAARHGSINNYWPHFSRRIGFDQLELQTLRNHIAPALTRGWSRLHEWSDETLYRPATGRSNIKWPIAHAGLVQGDLDSPYDPLVAYACELRGMGITDPEHPLSLDPDEFLQDLRLWIQQRKASIPSVLRDSISDDQIGPIVAELIQVRVRDSLMDLPCQEARIPTAVAQRPTARIVFNPLKQALLVRVNPGKYRRPTSAFLTFGDTERVLGGQEDRGSGITRFGDFDFPVGPESWPANVTIKTCVTEEPQIVVLPPFRFDLSTDGLTRGRKPNGAMLFDAETGQSLRQWKPDAPLYLICHKDRQEEEWVQDLFVLEPAMPLPVNGLSGFVAISLLGRTPQDRDEWRSMVATHEDTLESIGATFGMPSSREVFAPKIGVVDGIRLPGRGAPTYHIGSTDLLVKISGLPQPVPEYATFRRWDPQGSDSQQAIEAPLHEHNGAFFAGVTSDSTSDGYWQLEIAGTNEFPFLTSHDLPLPEVPPLPKLNIGDLASIEDAEYRLADIVDETLDVVGWPEARARIHIRTPTAHHHHTVRLDDEGHGTLIDFVDAISDFPSTIYSSILGRRSAQIRIESVAWIGRSDWHWDETTQQFSCELQNAEETQAVDLLFIGRRPWKGEFEVITCSVDDNHVQGTFIEADWSPVALAVMAYAQPNPPIANFSLDEATYLRARDLIGNTSSIDEFRPIAERLRRRALPIDLVELLEEFDVAMALTPVASAGLGRGWRQISTPEQVGLAADVGAPIVATEPGRTPGGSPEDNPILTMMYPGWSLVFSTDSADLEVGRGEESFWVEAVDQGEIVFCACGTLRLGKYEHDLSPLCTQGLTVAPGRELCDLFSPLRETIEGLCAQILAGARSEDPPPQTLKTVVSRLGEILARHEIAPAMVADVLEDTVSFVLFLLGLLDRPHNFFKINEYSTVTRSESVTELSRTLIKFAIEQIDER